MTQKIFSYEAVFLQTVQVCNKPQVIFNMTTVNVLFHLYLFKKGFGKTRGAECNLKCSYIMLNVHMVVCHHIPFVVVTCPNYYW